MAKQQCINQLFKKKVNAIEETFLQELERERESNQNKQSEIEKENESSWLLEKSSMSDVITGLTNENKEIKLKYEKLKTKHIELLQTLFNLEKKNQDMAINMQALKEKLQSVEGVFESNAKSIAETQSHKTTFFEIDMLADELVCFSIVKYY